MVFTTKIQPVEYVLRADELKNTFLINLPKHTLQFEKLNNYFWRVQWEDGEFRANVAYKTSNTKSHTALQPWLYDDHPNSDGMHNLDSRHEQSQ